jgi:hypothetical protein
MRCALWILAAVALATTGCRSRGPLPANSDAALRAGGRSENLAVRLDRGDWMVDQRTTVWKVLEEQPTSEAVQIGYLVRCQYRQARGGPAYSLYTVTTLNRREKIGRIDAMGRAYRYVPRRNQGFAEIDEGIGSLENNVGAIFQSRRRIILEQTTERRIAFELLDLNGDGQLAGEELATVGDRIRNADRNGDDAIDFEEFDQVDRL